MRMFPAHKKDKLTIFTLRKDAVDADIFNKTNQLAVFIPYVLSEYAKDPLRTSLELTGGVDVTELNGMNRDPVTVWYNHLGYHSYHTLPMNLDRVHAMGVEMKMGPINRVLHSNWPLPYTLEDRELMLFNPRFALSLGISMAIVASLYMVPYIVVCKRNV